MLNKEIRYIDALLPNEMALRAEEIAEKKAVMNFHALFVLSILAGAFIAFGAILSTTVVAGAAGFFVLRSHKIIGRFCLFTWVDFGDLRWRRTFYRK